MQSEYNSYAQSGDMEMTKLIFEKHTGKNFNSQKKAFHNAQKRISFDYDGTLDRLDIQKIAIQKIKEGDDVYIITKNTPCKIINDLANKLGIKRKNVIYTSHYPKWKSIRQLCIDEHYDDMSDEIAEIKEHTTAKTVKV